MADMNKLNKLSDEEIEGVAGGVMIDKNALNRTPYDKTEKNAVRTTELDDNMSGKITLLNGQTKSGGSAGAGNKNNAGKLLARQKVTNA